MILRFSFHLFIIAFLLNFLWEITQMPLFTTEVSVAAHWWFSVKDALLAVGFYLTVALFSGNLYWGRHLYKRRLLFLLALGFMWAAGVEYHALNSGRWAYAAAMPLIPYLKVGLAPVLQMMTLPALSVFLSRKQLMS